MPDVDMKPAQSTATSAPASKTVTRAPPSTEELLLALLRHNLALVQRSVLHVEARFSVRALRNLPTARRRIAEFPAVLARVIEEATESDSATRKELLALLPKAYEPIKVTAEEQEAKTDVAAMDVDEQKEGGDKEKSSAEKKGKENGEQKAAPAPKDLTARPSSEAQAEMDAYLKLLTATWLIDEKKVNEVSDRL